MYEEEISERERIVSKLEEFKPSKYNASKIKEILSMTIIIFFNSSEINWYESLKRVLSLIKFTSNKMLFFSIIIVSQHIPRFLKIQLNKMLSQIY